MQFIAIDKMDATFDQFKCASCRKGGINIFNYIKKIPLDWESNTGPQQF